MTDLAVDEVDHGEVVVFALRGELDLGTVPSFRDRLLDVVRTHRSVILDLAGLGFLDSTGLGLLVSAVKRLQACHGTLVVAAPSPAVRRLLEVSGLDGHLAIRETSDAALEEALAQPARDEA
ncbi:MAG: STAS domain-containing protein [Acidimicrobiales bacterium]